MRILLVAHDNFGSREIFSEIIKENPGHEYVLLITQGLYYRRSYFSSIVKLLREASFIFCLFRFLDMLIYRIRGDTLARRARKASIPVYFCSDINDEKTVSAIRDGRYDLLLSLFTMHIYKAPVLQAVKIAIGTHPSLLPEYRGLEVFFWQLANRETESGVSIFYLSEKIDLGSVIKQEKFLIDPDETVLTMYSKLTRLTARMMAEVVKSISTGGRLPTLYVAKKGTYFPMPTRESYQRFRKSGHKLF